ncbi:lebercilin-like protein [Melanotaenia boesemani]|uniref:lebercilin-like protein n=1 Tax=Melanotaenia boesemani TaxID=1250792 RepID=UPI001C05A1B0|nr:lebercilin-like protein [Melanotaenia boesemani]
MCERQRADSGDTASCSTDTSRWSIPSRQEKWPSLESPGSQKSGFKKDQARRGNMQKLNHHKLKLSQVKTMHVSKPRVQSASMHLIRALRSEVWDLQQQLSEAMSENKLLKQVQHRHTMALQHFQYSEGSIGQILAKHNSETRAHQKLLRETRICRDSLIKQLQATENKLFNTKAALQHLQQLSQDQNLLEREELTLRLAKATAGLEDKDRRIQDMERNLELCQASFKRQIVTEQRKVKEARNMSFYLQDHVHQLTTESKEREKEMDKHKIYSHRFLKGSSNKGIKGRKNKMVQTDELVNIATNTSSLQETESEDMVHQQGNWPCNNQKQESLGTENPEKKVSSRKMKLKEDTEMCSGPSVLIKKYTSKNNYLEESLERTPKHQIQHLFTKREVSESLLNLKQQITHEASISEKSLKATEEKKKKCKLPKIRHSYTFKQSVENLHNGLPAYSNADMRLPDITKDTITAESLSRGIQDLCLLGGKFRKGEGNKSHESKESSTDKQTHEQFK